MPCVSCLSCKYKPSPQTLFLLCQHCHCAHRYIRCPAPPSQNVARNACTPAKCHEHWLVLCAPDRIISPLRSQLTSPDVPPPPQPLLRQEVAANVVEGHFAGSQMFPFFSPFFVHQHPASSISPRAVVVVSGSAPRPHVNNALNGSYDQFSLERAELSPHITGCFKVACINTWTSTWPERLESHIVDSRPSWRQTMQFAALCRPPLPPSAAPSSSQSVTCLWPH